MQELVHSPTEEKIADSSATQFMVKYKLRLPHTRCIIGSDLSNN